MALASLQFSSRMCPRAAGGSTGMMSPLSSQITSSHAHYKKRGSPLASEVSNGIDRGLRRLASVSPSSSGVPVAGVDPSIKLLPSDDDRFSGLKVLVVGATGGVGRWVTLELAERKIPVRGLVRDMSKASTAFKELPDLDLVLGDVYQYTTLPPAFDDCNAVIVCTGARDYKDPFGPFNIDYEGTLNLISVAQRKKVKKFILVTSIGTDDPYNPLNLFWGVLFWKKRAEEALQRSGLNYTIVRPGGLKDSSQAGEAEGEIVMAPANTYGFPPFKASGAILRKQVARVCVEALVEDAAKDKVVEIIAEPNAPRKLFKELFSNVK